MNEFLFTEDFVFPDFLLVNRDDVQNTTTSMTKTDMIRVLKYHLWQQVTKQRED